MARKRKYTDNKLKEVVKVSKSWAQVLRTLGLKQAGGNQTHLKTISRNLDLDWSHFTGKLWSKGSTRQTDKRIDSQAKKQEVPDSKVFIKNSGPITGTRLRKRLLRLGWIYECYECKLKPTWNELPLCLHVHHINGTHNDNRLTNLKFLCPNCHQQTDIRENKQKPE